MIGVDTNILLRWIVDDAVWPIDDRAQYRAIERLLSDEGQTIFVNSVVVHEIVWLLHRPARQPKAVILDLLDKLLSASQIHLQHREAFEAAREVYAQSRCDFYDCLIAQINAREGCRTTYTFDKAASKTEGFELLRGRAPS